MASLTLRVKIIHHSSATEQILHFRGLARHLGIATELVELSDASSLKNFHTDPSAGVVLDVDSLAKLSSPNDLAAIRANLQSRNVAVLLLANESGEAASRLLETLTGGAIGGVVAAGQGAAVRFPAEAGPLTGELASYSYPRRPSAARGLILAGSANAEVLMAVDQSPTFVRVPVGAASVFVWSTPRVFDIQRPLAAELEFEEALDEYIPAIIFLRAACGDQCWHSPNPSAALVIDDPLLTNNYGFISFPQLLASARKHGYHVTLAFIPWNYRRTRARQVGLFREHADCFSLCTHGCDHTNNEFRSTDYDSLLRKSFVARQRMEAHRERTGLPCEPLMVCPQEQYSLQGMRALSDSRQFLGLVNTACMPRNLTAPQICGTDLLLPAQDFFFGFPIFKRHYWRDMSVFALSLFLGKPAILVEHHKFFRGGSAGAEVFAAGLAKLRPNLKWRSMVETATRTHMRRRVAEGRQEVRFFTDIFHLEHVEAHPVDYHLTRRIPAATNVQRVTINGSDVPFTRENGMLGFEVRVDRPEEVEIRVLVPAIKPTKPYPAALKYQFGVAFRRGLSELRDNLIARNQYALKAANSLMRMLKQAGGR